MTSSTLSRDRRPAPRLAHRCRRGVDALGPFVLVQLAVQAITLLVGLIVVNVLARSEYALYSLSIAFANSVTAIAGAGFSVAILARGSKVRHERSALSSLVASGLLVRRRVTLLICLVAAPTLGVMLVRNGASSAQAAVMSGLVIAGAVVGASIGVYTDLLALEYRRGAIQRIALLVAASRLAAACCLLLASKVLATIPIAINSAALWLTRLLQSRHVRQHVDRSIAADLDDTRYAWRSFAALAPSSVFLVVQAQVVIFAAGVMGKSGTLADIGAVSRVTTVLGVVGASVAAVVAPFVARSEPCRVARRYLVATLGLGLVLILVVGLACLATSPLLRLLGPEYAGLGTALRLVFVAASITCLADAMNSLNAARGWIAFAWVQIPLGVAAITAGLTSLDIGRASQAGAFMIATALPALLAQLVRSMVGLRSLNAAPVAP